MMAAISALENGASVTIAEKENRLGKKVLVTGNGRCNVTNMNITAENYHGANPLLTNNIFAQFDNKQTISFFNNLGVVTKVEERGRVFPMSDQASSVVDILTHRLKDLGAKIIYETKVEDIKKIGDEFKVRFSNNTEAAFDRVVIAAGGKAMPALGSDGSGYTLSESLGHTVTPTWPSLVQLRLEGGFFNEIKGVKIDGSAALVANDKAVAKESGEILFTHYGVSGPAILKLSRKAKEHIVAGEKVTLRLTLLNGLDEEKLDKFLADRFNMLHKKAIKTSFLGFLQKRLIPEVLKAAQIENADKKCAEISANERKNIVKTLLAWDFPVIDTNSFKDAQVTAGGVNTNEVDAKTLESKIVPGLYFCGEVLDIDGDSGGYNLQFAWSSGYIAGRSATK